ncbi:hypothetical protein DEU56DRAFT_756918 [Suillus clintonianus]|uniref:uncharacterized protein n=1 Tax=Suillus clintonianus TaxID=1904413 RepID=UPI001B8720CF|nr:uncharacterized protein DEU56DRAFT_756918 [Suillus clintonianus]KAG2134484.1 hypothetical protein DEU56DRAFT_756918 [Suillus clintonianus]
MHGFSATAGAPNPVIVLPQSGPEPWFEPELFRTGLKVRSQVWRGPWTELQTGFFTTHCYRRPGFWQFRHFISQVHNQAESPPSISHVPAIAQNASSAANNLQSLSNVITSSPLLFFTDHTKDTFKISGTQVSPVEIET